MSYFGWCSAFIISLVLCNSSFARNEEMVVRYPKVLHEQASLNVYFVGILKHALEISESEFGPFRLEETTIYMEQDRSLQAVADGDLINIQWSMTSREREKLLFPVRVPLIKGLMGCRVFLVQKGREDEFADIQLFQQLQAYTAGQAHDWPDTAILEANGLKVVKGRDSIKLINMLKLGRFDFFPRGLTEARNELQATRSKSLVLEPHLMLFYSAPVYFFVGKQNARLADRLKLGLEKMYEDGSFDKGFMALLERTGILQEQPFERRRIFRLENPLLPKETPLDDTRLWWTGMESLVKKVRE